MRTKKKVLVGAGTLAGIAVLSIGGVAAAFANGSTGTDHHDESALTGATLQRASDAALKATGGGKVTDSGRSDDSAVGYDIEVTTTSGTQVDVRLDKSFVMVKQETEVADASEAPLTGATLQRASAAALKAVGGGTVTDTSSGDDAGVAYDVEVTSANGKHVDVQLDSRFTAIKQSVGTEN